MGVRLVNTSRPRVFLDYESRSSTVPDVHSWGALASMTQSCRYETCVSLVGWPRSTTLPKLNTVRAEHEVPTRPYYRQRSSPGLGFIIFTTSSPSQRVLNGICPELLLPSGGNHRRLSADTAGSSSIWVELEPSEGPGNRAIHPCRRTVYYQRKAWYGSVYTTFYAFEGSARFKIAPKRTYTKVNIEEMRCAQLSSRHKGTAACWVPVTHASGAWLCVFFHDGIETLGGTPVVNASIMVRSCKLQRSTA